VTTLAALTGYYLRASFKSKFAVVFGAVQPLFYLSPLMSTLVIPLMLLSGALLPMSLAPAWLDVVSRFTPFRYTVEALRALFAGSSTSSTVLWGVLVTVVFTGVGSTIGTKVFQRENT
jgi:ABC-2 type transport system permease protein